MLNHAQKALARRTSDVSVDFFRLRNPRSLTRRICAEVFFYGSINDFISIMGSVIPPGETFNALGETFEYLAKVSGRIEIVETSTGGAKIYLFTGSLRTIA